MIWKQNFEFVESVPSFILGYKRVFFQGSTDHRGVPGKPGRVVTLIRDAPDSRVYGLAFRIAADHKETALKALDIREKGGYDRVMLPCHKHHHDEEIVCDESLVYIANEENEEYLGPAPTEAIAQQILECTGPSGPNRDYLFNLADSLSNFGFDDDHVQSIATCARNLLAESKSGTS